MSNMRFGALIFNDFKILRWLWVSSVCCRIRVFLVKNSPSWRRCISRLIRGQVLPVSNSAIRIRSKANQHKRTWERIRSSLLWYTGRRHNVLFIVRNARSTSSSCLYPRAISSADKLSSLVLSRYLPSSFSSCWIFTLLIFSFPLFSSLT